MKIQYVAVAPREGRVSRNIRGAFTTTGNLVAPREGRVASRS